MDHITKLENTQKFALRICSKQWNLGYQELLELTNCPTLRNRRLYSNLCTLYDLIYFPPNVFSPKHNSAAIPLLHQPFARTNAYSSSFVPSSSSLWNNLPHDALIADSIQSSVNPLFLCPYANGMNYYRKKSVSDS